MAIIPTTDSVYRCCKVFDFDTVCHILRELKPNGWGVYGNNIDDFRLRTLADFMGKSFNSTGGSIEVESRTVNHTIEGETKYRYIRDGKVVSTVIRTQDPDFEFHDNEGVRRFLSWEEWDQSGPTHVILPLRLLSSDAPEMFDANVLFTTSTESVMLVKTTSKKAPIFVCRVNGLI
jgi:hypothetical protein|nr:MAG TPA: hypothetical protein [Caudoviricetes sp.]